MNKKITVVIHKERLPLTVVVEGERQGTFKTTRSTWRGSRPADLPWFDDLNLPLYWSHGRIIVASDRRPRDYHGPVLFNYTPHKESPPIAVAVCDRQPDRSFLVAEWMTMTGIINCYPSTKVVDIFLFESSKTSKDRKEVPHDDR